MEPDNPKLLKCFSGVERLCLKTLINHNVPGVCVYQSLSNKSTIFSWKKKKSTIPISNFRLSKHHLVTTSQKDRFRPALRGDSTNQVLVKTNT